MTKKRPAPLPPAVLAEDLLDAPRRPDRHELTWLRRPTSRATDEASTEGENEAV